MSDTRETALVALLRELRALNYHFTTPTPATHARVIARRGRARDARDVFGWSLLFAPAALSEDLLTLMRAAYLLEENSGEFRSRVRVSSLGDDLYLHSAYPTVQHDAVFFGPDSYRYATFLNASLQQLGDIGTLVDIGTGSGVGAIVAARSAKIARVVGTDINPQALQFARANAAAAGVKACFLEGSGMDAVNDTIDVVIANPPYILDDGHRAYRDGGALHGAALSLDWAMQAADKLRVGGALLLYTGSAIVGGVDRFELALRDALSGFDVRYREIDPDVFGEELERDAYADVERIAVVGVVAVKK